MEEKTSNGKVEAESPKVGRHDKDEKQEANQVSAELKPEVESTGAGNCLLVIEAQQDDDAEQESSQTQTENPEEDEQVVVSDNTTLVPVETPGSLSSLAEEPGEDVQVQAKTDVPMQPLSVEAKVGFSEMNLDEQLPTVEGEIPEMNLDEQEIPIVEENPAEPSARSSEEDPVNHNRDLPLEITNHSPIIPLTQPTLQHTSWRSCCGLLQVLRRSET